MTQPSRRTVLRGLGTFLALPALASLGSARADVAPPPRRFLAWFLPCGVVPSQWNPATTGAAYALSPMLQPLGPVRDRVRLFTGLQNTPLFDASHDGRTKSALTRYIGMDPSRESPADAVDISLDQAIADVIGGATPYASLVVGSEPGEGCPPPDCGTWLYHTSWRGAADPVPVDRSTRSVFERLFGAPDQGGRAPLERQAARRSVLDAVLGDVASLESRLAPEDRPRLDAYLTGVRAIERRLEPVAACGGSPAPDTDDFQEHLPLMQELLVQALVCDRTRVLSYMPGNGRSHRRFDFLGMEHDHHQSSHSSPTEHTTITAWYVARYVEVLQRLQAEKEADGSSLLDHTYALLYSGMGDGNEHDTNEMPLLLGGGPQDAWTGAHTRLQGQPTARLHYALLKAYHPTATHFGRFGTSPLITLA